MAQNALQVSAILAKDASVCLVREVYLQGCVGVKG
jgi:hypothetical protein